MSDTDLLRLGALLEKLKSNYTPPKSTGEIPADDSPSVYSEKKIRKMERSKQKVEQQIENLNSAIQSTVKSGLSAYWSAKELDKENNESNSQEETLNLFISLLGSTLDMQSLIKSNPFATRSSDVTSDVQIAFWEEICRRAEDEISNINISETPQALTNHLAIFIKLADVQAENFDTQSSIRTMEDALEMVLGHQNFDKKVCRFILSIILTKLRDYAQDIGSYDKFRKYSRELEQLSDGKPDASVVVELTTSGNLSEAPESEASDDDQVEQDEEEEEVLELPPPLQYAFFQAEVSSYTRIIAPFNLLIVTLFFVQDFNNFGPFEELLSQFRQGLFSREVLLIANPHSGRTPAMLFAMNNRLDLIDRLLMGSGPRTIARSLIEEVDEEQKNALFYAASNGHIHIVEDLLFRLGVARFEPISQDLSALNLPIDNLSSVSDVSKALFTYFLQSPQHFVRIACIRRGLPFEGLNILTASISHVAAPPLEMPKNIIMDSTGEAITTVLSAEVKEESKDDTNKGEANSLDEEAEHRGSKDRRRRQPRGKSSASIHGGRKPDGRKSESKDQRPKSKSKQGKANLQGPQRTQRTASKAQVDKKRVQDKAI